MTGHTQRRTCVPKPSQLSAKQVQEPENVLHWCQSPADCQLVLQPGSPRLPIQETLANERRHARHSLVVADYLLSGVARCPLHR